MKLFGVLSALLGWVLACPLCLNGQTTQITSTPKAVPDIYPDQGFLSATRYVNRYFGFGFDIPVDLGLVPVPQPVPRDGRIQLLQLGGPPPAYALISIVAFPLHGRLALDAKGILRQALDQELNTGVEELHGLSKTLVAGHVFYTYETRRGGDQHLAMAFNLEGHAVVVTLGATSGKVVKELEDSLEHATFVTPSKSRELAGADAEEYDGPAVSAHRLAQFKSDPPANHIDPGKISGRLYENQGLGFGYPIPPGWTLEEHGAIQPAIERSQRQDFETLWTESSEHDLMKVCNRTLFSAWATRPAADGQLSYDDFGEITVSAVPATCFPGVRFPTSPADHRAVQDFLLQLRLTHPVLQTMRDIRAFSSGGNVFVLLHGSVGFKVPDDLLSRRLSVAMSITERRGYILTWFFAAPHDSELRELLDAKITFHNGPPLAASVTKPGGGEAEPANGDPQPAQEATPGQVEATSGPSGPAAAGPDSSGSAAAAAGKQSDPPTPSPSKASFPQTGATVPEQQGKGQQTPQP